MAAFIQKLFRSRKTSDASPKPRKEAPPVDTQQEDERANRREAQLKLLDDAPGQDTLSELALVGITADIRQQAVSRLTDAACLQKVQKQAKGRDKSVYQTAKQALQVIRDEQTRQENISQSIATLLKNIADLANTDDTKLYEARLETLVRQWRDLESEASPDQAQQFLESVHRCNERLKAVQTAQEEEQRHQAQQQERKETLALLTSTLEDLKHQSPEDLPSLASLDALQKTQENRWMEATRDTTVEKQEQKTYESAMHSLRNYVSAVRRIHQEKEALTALAAAAESDEDAGGEQQGHAKALLGEVNWPEGFPVPSLLEPARKLAGKRKQQPVIDKADAEKQKALAAQLEATIEQLDAALEAKQLKESKQLLKTAQQQHRSLDQRHGRAFQARMQLLNGQLRELSDWQGFATEPKQIALCEQMEYLAEQPMEPEAKAERIKELQNEWRELGGSSDRTLWTRFKKASDKAYEPCKAYFSAKSGLKQANLDKRNAICDELESFLSNADWSTIEWKAAEKIHQTARQEWKAAWPVEFRDNRSVQKRFDDLLKKLESPLNEERLKNEALKQDIVDQANALIEHEPLHDAMNQAKRLQADWKAIGITRHREDRKMWQAFRKACDQIFARRDAQRSEQAQATQVANQEAESALSTVRSITHGSGEEAVIAGLERLKAVAGSALSGEAKAQVQTERKRLQDLLEHSRLSAHIDAWQSLVLARVDGPLPPTDTPDHWASLASTASKLTARELVIRAEILSGIPSPESDQQHRMEIQVQRLAEGMGSADKSADHIGELEKLVAGWCLNERDGQPDQTMAHRLNSALSAVVSN
ncbi:hypothetical protein D777_02097 [Marinobacter nitratireducens]|uniref:DUF349 domain-containing protein n=1 Tax=Marinobacter nitratireducens TaxID=1137280 RepID=A0A072N446_9GAMM|nr:DUF349 domain-containing protein [Marinobacter nitratireducens]KEF31748.1 hypothetical protein D777_02097 [Marinobacter nitratireducens]TNE98664.1 MAG: DUF349 domain-containing protein [Gammaproteobacteria bacterium]